MQPKRQKIVFEVWNTEEFLIIQVEPEACQWTIKRDDKFEIAWLPDTGADEPATIVWHGRNCVAVFPPAQYKVRLNGVDAFELL